MGEASTEVTRSGARARAIEGGALLDVSEEAWEECFRYPVAVSAAVMRDVRRVPKRSRRSNGQEPGMRLRELLGAAHLAAPQIAEAACVYYWSLMPAGRKNMYRAKLIVGPGDRGEMVATIMRPDEVGR